MARIDDLRSNLNAVRVRIAAAEKAAGREPGSVTLLPVTKFHPASDLGLLAELGVTEVGENREQEARKKAAQFPEVHVTMIGQLQTKKANAVARWAHAVHSVDSAELARKLDHGMELALERGDRTGDVLGCFIQFSADGDTSRGGAVEADIVEIAQVISDAQFLRLRGLMVVPPLDADPAEVFTRARALTDALGSDLELSAGMSGDMEEAISAGSDIVRVGTDIMGRRPIA